MGTGSVDTTGAIAAVKTCKLVLCITTRSLSSRPHPRHMVVTILWLVQLSGTLGVIPDQMTDVSRFCACTCERKLTECLQYSFSNNRLSGTLSCAIFAPEENRNKTNSATSVGRIWENRSQLRSAGLNNQRISGTFPEWYSARLLMCLTTNVRIVCGSDVNTTAHLVTLGLARNMLSGSLPDTMNAMTSLGTVSNDLSLQIGIICCSLAEIL